MSCGHHADSSWLKGGIGPGTVRSGVGKGDGSGASTWVRAGVIGSPFG
jgi:hypothetical protein